MEFTEYIYNVCVVRWTHVGVSLIDVTKHVTKLLCLHGNQWNAIFKLKRNITKNEYHHRQTKCKKKKIEMKSFVYSLYSMWDSIICADQKGIASSHSSLAVICDTNVKYPRVSIFFFFFVFSVFKSIFHLKLIRSHVYK